MKLAIVVLNWNGLKLLKEFFPSVYNYSKKHSIYLIDNNSSDNSILYIKENFPLVNIIKNSENFSFAKGYNEGLKMVKEDIYCLLNNDVEVTENWLDPIITQFKNNESLVIAQPKILDFKHRNKFEYAGAAGGYIDYFGYPYCRGRIFNSIEIDNGQYDQITDIFWASGACFFIKKEIFHELKGFDINFVNHMEEIDLCWRITNLNPNYVKKFIYQSKVYHLGGGSLNYNDPKKLFFNIRNQRYMLKKNLKFGLNKILILLITLFINLLIAFKYLIFLKFNHFYFVLKAVFPKSFLDFKYEYLNIVDKKNISKENNKHNQVTSILFDYLILRRRKFSELNKS